MRSSTITVPKCKHPSPSQLIMITEALVTLSSVVTAVTVKAEPACFIAAGLLLMAMGYRLSLEVDTARTQRVDARPRFFHNKEEIGYRTPFASTAVFPQIMNPLERKTQSIIEQFV